MSISKKKAVWFLGIFLSAGLVGVLFRMLHLDTWYSEIMLLAVQLAAIIWFISEHMKKPNQALEPTSTAVTPPADAGDRASGTRGSP